MSDETWRKVPRQLWVNGLRVYRSKPGAWGYDFYRKLSRRQRFTQTLGNIVHAWDDAIPMSAPDWAYAPEWHVIERVCKLLNAHVPVDDHCGKPTHRHCSACGALTPNAEVVW